MNKLFSMFGNDSDEPPFDYALFLERSRNEAAAKTAAHDQTWHLGEASFAVDQGEGTIIFTTPRGVTATCPVQIIGTFNTEDETWLWGWDHPSIEPALAQDAHRMFEFGQQHNLDRLTTRKFPSTREECLDFASMACKLSEAQGVYAGQVGTPIVYMTFGEVVLKKTQEV